MKLGKREKYFVSIGAGVLAVFLVLQFIVTPVFEKRDRVQRGIGAKEEALEEIVLLRSQYEALKKGAQQAQEVLAKRESGFTLFSFLERAGGEARVKEHIESMKPSVSAGPGPYQESMVEMKLEQITLNQLVQYLHLIESPDHVVFIKRLSIKENRKKERSLDAIVQAYTFQEAG